MTRRGPSGDAPGGIQPRRRRAPGPSRSRCTTRGVRSRRQGNDRTGVQGVALATEHADAVQAHLEAAAALGPEDVRSAPGRPQLPFPREASTAQPGQGLQVAADHVDGAGRQHPQVDVAIRDRGADPRRRPKRDEQQQRRPRGDEPEPERSRPEAARRGAAERRHHGQDDGRTEEGKGRAGEARDPQGRLGMNGGEAEEGEGEEKDGGRGARTRQAAEEPDHRAILFL